MDHASNDMHKVLVLDAHQRSALAIIRSLGRHGLTVIAGSDETNALGAASRYVAAAVRYPNPAAAPRSFVHEIVTIADRLGIDTIIPTTDLTTMLLVSQPDVSKIAHLAAPSAESYEALTDKARLVELAGSLGISTPVTRIVHTETAVAEAAQDIGFPIVLKPARSRYLKDDRICSTSVEIVNAPENLSTTLSRMTCLRDIPCLVQRFIPGHGAGVFALYASAQPVAWFAHRRIREKPPTGGVSVLCESVPIDSAMQSAAGRLLAAADWTGVAMVEFRVAHDGTPCLMEVNGRFWGSLQLAIDCGVDFPWLLYRHIRGLPVTAPASYALGRRVRWLLGDFDSLLISLRQTASNGVPKARVLAAFLRSFADLRCRQEILRFHDIRPGLREMVQWLNALRPSPLKLASRRRPASLYSDVRRSTRHR